jgi:hypothetical protein
MYAGVDVRDLPPLTLEWLLKATGTLSLLVYFRSCLAARLAALSANLTSPVSGSRIT